VVAGAVATALHGAEWVDAGIPIELIAENARPQCGLVVRDESLNSREVTFVRGLPVTTVPRTAFDLGRHFPRHAAVSRLDALMRAAPFSIGEVKVLAAQHKGARGLRRLRESLALADGSAMSPKERQLVAVFDLGWEDYKVAAEYDGDYHRSDRRRFVKDIDKLGIADEQGWIVIRVVSEHRPGEVVGRAYRALAGRGWRPDRRQRAALSRFLTLPSISA
jgi:hypothetical protein